MKIAIVLGTRPEIIKCAPIVWELKRRGHEFRIIDTGQHNASEMTDIFYGEMGYQPNIRLGNFCLDRTPERIASALISLGAEMVVVQGDTDSAFLGALAACSKRLTVVHVEAGLRSGDLAMREERNRIAIDAMSDLCLAPTDDAASNIPGLSIVTGNTIADVVLKYTQNQDEPQRRHVLLTLHRRETVDDEARLAGCILGALRAADRLDLPLVFPVHPRTAQKLQEFNLPVPTGLEWREPVGFAEFLQLERESAVILTDSGGVQEEACILGVPCVTLRNNTERPETIEIGANILAGYMDNHIVREALQMAQANHSWDQPYGDGNAGKRIVDAVEGLL